jgi:trigger factor
VTTAPVTTSVERLDEVRVRLVVEAAPERVRTAFDRAARSLSKDLRIPGFRPGRAPRPIVQQHVGIAAIAQAALEDALQEYYSEALGHENLDTVARPELDVQRFDEQDGCAFTVTVEVRPEVVPAPRDGISVSHPEWQVPDADVDLQIDALRERFAEVSVVERPAAAGDLVTIDLRVEVGGELVEGGSIEGALYEVGSGGVTPELDRRVLGASAGDVLTYEDELPAGYPGHGGATASFTVTVTDVREKRLPAADDDFADSAGGFDSIDDLRADVRRSLLRRRVLEGRHQLRGVVTEAYVARHEVPVPPSLLADTVAERMERLSEEAQRLGGTLDELLALEGTSREQHEERLREQSERTLRAQFVLDALARQLELKVTSRDLDGEVARIAAEQGIEPARVARLIRDQGTLPVLVGDVLRRMAIDALVAAAEVRDGPDAATLIDLGLAPAEAAAAADAPAEAADEA